MLIHECPQNSWLLEKSATETPADRARLVGLRANRDPPGMHATTYNNTGSMPDRGGHPPVAEERRDINQPILLVLQQGRNQTMSKVVNGPVGGTRETGTSQKTVEPMIQLCGCDGLEWLARTAGEKPGRLVVPPDGLLSVHRLPGRGRGPYPPRV